MPAPTHHKTRGQLIEELEELRHRLAEYEAGTTPGAGAADVSHPASADYKYRALIDNLKDVVFTIDTKGKISFASRAAEDVLGFRAGELVNTNILDYLLEDDKPKVIAAVARGMEGEKIAQFESRARTATGNVVVLEISGSRLWEDGKAVGALAIARDITLRKRAESALREREEIYRTMFVASPDGILISDPAMTEIIYANPAFCRMVEYREDQLQDLTVPALHPAKEWSGILAQYQSLARGERQLLPDVPLRTATGELVHADISGSPASIEGIACTIAFFRNTTRRRQDQERIIHSEELLRATLESTADGIVAMNKRGAITHANRKFIEMWRVPAQLEKSLDDKLLLHFMMVQLRDPSIFFMQIQELFVNLKQSFNTLEFKDDRVFEHQSAPLVRDGRIEGRVWSFKDITLRTRALRELEVANSKLRELDVLKDHFLSMVSHDLRTPMTGIMAYAQILLERNDGLDDDTRKKYLGIIIKQGERLTRLINDLLDISKFEAGKMTMDFEEIDLIQLTLEALDAFQGAVGDKQIALEKKLRGKALVRGSRDRLHQVMANLLSNALKFTPVGGRITVSADLAELDHKPGIKISVADTGSGIPPDQLERVFEKFHQTGQQARDQGRGSGLGLALVREIVAAHQGRAGLESELGQGSIFYFILPV